MRRSLHVAIFYDSPQHLGLERRQLALARHADTERRAALAELTAYDQEIGLS